MKCVEAKQNQQTLNVSTSGGLIMSGPASYTHLCLSFACEVAQGIARWMDQTKRLHASELDLQSWGDPRQAAEKTNPVWMHTKSPDEHGVNGEVSKRHTLPSATGTTCLWQSTRRLSLVGNSADGRWQAAKL